MNNNLLNNKRERAKENKEIIVTLEKMGPNSYKYLGDSLQDRTKIKIPLVDEKNSDLKNGQADKNLQIKEKSINSNLKIIAQNSTNNTQINTNTSDIKSQSIENKPVASTVEEIPLLAKYVEKNFKQQLIIPSCAQWFNFDSINDIETKALPEFFCGVFPSKTPEIYKEYRNYIINLYRENTNSYLSSSACRKHLSGDVCSIMRIHAFLEHWGIINFNLESANKMNNTINPKSYNFKSPIYLDIASLTKISEDKSNSTINTDKTNIDPNSPIVILNDNEEIQKIFPIKQIDEIDEKIKAYDELSKSSLFNLSVDNSFKLIFNKNSLNTILQINFLAKNYRPKCDVCENLCNIDWYMLRKQENNNKSFLICEVCFESGLFSKFNNKKEDFEMANFFNIINPSEKFNNLLKERVDNEKWTTEETIRLLSLIEKYGNNWEFILYELNSKRTKNDCIIHLLQLPLRSDVLYLFLNVKENKVPEITIKEGENNKLEPQEGKSVFDQILFFAKMFENYVEDNNHIDQNYQSNCNGTFEDNCKINQESDSSTLKKPNKRDFSNINVMKELIYKVFSKSVHSSKTLQKVQKQKMKKIVSLLIFLQMRKIEMKLMYFNEFEKIIQYDSQQLKSKESQALQDRLKLVFKKADIMTISNKFKDIAAQFKEASEKFDLKDMNKMTEIISLIEEANKMKIDNSENLLDLN